MENSTKRKRSTVLSLALVLTALGTFSLGGSQVASASAGGAPGGSGSGGSGGSGSSGGSSSNCEYDGKTYSQGACLKAACSDNKAQKCTGGSWGSCANC
jgi:hypothetical protein